MIIELTVVRPSGNDTAIVHTPVDLKLHAQMANVILQKFPNIE